jgi:hypothetical protein
MNAVDYKILNYGSVSTYVTALGAFPKEKRESDYNLRHDCLCVHAWNNSALIGQIFIKFDTWWFLEYI